MATTPAEILAAIDDAILEWAGKPITISQGNRSITYRSLDELIAARRHYAKLNIATQNQKPFTISHLKAGGPRD